MTTAGALGRGRSAFDRRDWAQAWSLLSSADRDHALEPRDLERLAAAAYLTGRDEESQDAWARAHHDHLSRGEVERAARCAFWLAFGLLNKGESARAGGWLGRARRLLDGERDCVEQGYLLLPIAIRCVVEGDAAAGHAHFTRAMEIGERFGDPDLVVLARHGQGRALIRQGDIPAGAGLLDEAMAAVEAGDVSPLVAGDIYCSVIEACHEVFDLRRAREWTDALTRWCESQPGLVPYRGQCLVRRAEIMRLHGAWGDAMGEAERACDWLTRPPGEPAAGEAYYQRAELHRLRGEFAEAEEAYRQASRWTRRPRPGLARLRLAQGRLDAAVAAIRSVMEEARDRHERCQALPAQVEIMLAARDVPAARAAAGELAELAAAVGAPLLHAAAAHARGAVLLAEGDARAALDALRQAWSRWERLEAPYEAARARVLIGEACRAMGDVDAAELELEAARWAFRRLGARPELDRLEAPGRRAAVSNAGGLTRRELEVLRLVAAGETNKAIAARLFISERTVERHVSNIFGKLGVTSRSGATAFAYKHQLV